MNPHPLVRWPLAALVAVALVLAGCSGGGSSGLASIDRAGNQEPAPRTELDDDPGDQTDPADEQEEEEEEEEEEPAEPDDEQGPDDAAGPNELPDVTIIDVASGEEVSLASYAPAETPIVLWFWAPH